ncbi:hypothetical protein BJY18_007296 [Amycolatopsis jiangsuensis]|uniref:Uncharacterized protein n=1 Tax=Amycolatopsis jiangsuensis TaxID=1181879 RepID=A0A840J419_9PSEU|nr:hypothetical protein [Amycolatopsis jiangsuensis]MBB4689811.1 hypothetical protein [Amycolatopsis jiangsuensis]
MDDLIAEIRYMLRHPIRANAATCRAVADTELGAALAYLVQHPMRSLRETFTPIFDDIARGMGR